MMNKPLLLVLILFSLYSCRREDNIYDMEFLLPLAEAELSMQNIIADSNRNAIGANANSNAEVSLVYKYDLFRILPEDYFKIPDSTEIRTFNLENLQLANREIKQTLLLEEVYPPSVLLDGQTVTVPEQTFTGVPPVPVDASEFFETATLKSGFMDVSIYNGFPVRVNTLEFRLKNNVNGQIIFQETFNNIQPLSTATKSIDLSGKTIDYDLVAEIVSLKTDASDGPVMINKEDSVTMTFYVRDMKAQSATAIFPAQSLIKREENTVYDLGGAQLKLVKLRRGFIRFRIVSTIQERMFLDYEIPYALKDGQTVKRNLIIPPAPANGRVEVIDEFPLEGYTIDMSGRPGENLVNAFFNTLDARIDSTGQKTTLSLSDSIFLYYGIEDMLPEYAEGYFGSQTFGFPSGETMISAFKNLSGNIELDDIKMSLDVENGLGANGILNINNIIGTNTRTGRNVVLNGTTLGMPLPINSATKNPFNPFYTSLTVNKNNSNIVAFVENLPDQIRYNASAVINPNPVPNSFSDWLTDRSVLATTLNVEVPLNARLNNLQICDTTPFAYNNNGRQSQIKEGTINIIADNSFPLDFNITIYMLDKWNGFIDSIYIDGNQFIRHAEINPLTGKTIGLQRSILKLNISEQQLYNLIGASYLVYKAGVTSNSAAGIDKVKIFSDYLLRLKLTTNLVYGQKL